jgi:protocatechuate 3,4-dioxygenase beta subunit
VSIKQLLTVFVFCFALLLSTEFVSAQGTTSRLTGTVTDASGAAISGATVTLTNEGTAISLTTVTGESGAYTFDLIPAGSYQVTV